MATAFGVRLLGTASVVITGFHGLPGHETRWLPSIIAVVSQKITKAVPSDTVGKLREVISSPGGAAEISRWWSEAQPPGLVIRRFFASRQGRWTGILDRTNPGPAPFQGAWSCRDVSGGCASLRHRLISLAPPALYEFASSIPSARTPKAPPICFTRTLRLFMKIGWASVCRRTCILDVRSRTQRRRRGPCSRSCNNRRNIPCPPARDKSRSCARIFQSCFPTFPPA
jgi:hypothetical protein